MGYAVAYPIMQSALVVAALWGVFVWKEITNRKVLIVLFAFCSVVLGGCVLISYGATNFKDTDD